MLLSTCLGCDVHYRLSPGGKILKTAHKLNPGVDHSGHILHSTDFLRVSRNNTDYHVVYLKHSIKE